MANDVTLQEVGNADILRIEAPSVRVAGRDLMLDSPERRKSNTPPFRRALVHNQSDGLTVNFGGDYPGGVTLNGVTEITPHLPDLVVHGGITFEMPGVKLGGGKVKIPASLTEELGKLQTQISELAAKVKTLGG